VCRNPEEAAKDGAARAAGSAGRAARDQQVGLVDEALLAGPPAHALDRVGVVLEPVGRHRHDPPVAERELARLLVVRACSPGGKVSDPMLMA